VLSGYFGNRRLLTRISTFLTYIIITLERFLKFNMFLYIMRSSLKIMGFTFVWLVRGKVIDLAFARPETVSKNKLKMVGS
jgi:hypothetical protein